MNKNRKNVTISMPIPLYNEMKAQADYLNISFSSFLINQLEILNKHKEVKIK